MVTFLSTQRHPGLAYVLFLTFAERQSARMSEIKKCRLGYRWLG